MPEPAAARLRRDESHPAHRGDEELAMKVTVGDRLIVEGAYGTDSRREGFVAGR
ncbi:hypothetical protein [Nonomuraea wenchangensis]|uniref:hypothetical protein n=1 Tax=Nonomuraea wenchangensis TaxID=568860 RepID=UPI00340A0551